MRGGAARRSGVELLTRDGGVAGRDRAQAPRTRASASEQQPTELDDLHIDIGAKDGAEARRARSARRRGRARGASRVELAERPRRLALARQPPRRLRRARGGAAARGGRTARPGDVVGGRDRAGGGRRLRRRADVDVRARAGVAIAIDVTHATDVPGGDRRSRASTGSAAARRSRAARRSTRKIFDLLVEAAEAEGIPYTIEVSRARRRPTWTRCTSRAPACATGLVSIPLRYMHTPTEIVELEDVDACARLLAAFARRLSPASNSRAEPQCLALCLALLAPTLRPRPLSIGCDVVPAWARAARYAQTRGSSGDRDRGAHAVRAGSAARSRPTRRRSSARIAIRAALDRDRPRADEVEYVIMGQVLQARRGPGAGAPGGDRRGPAEGAPGRHDQQGVRVLDARGRRSPTR